MTDQKLPALNRQVQKGLNDHYFGIANKTAAMLLLSNTFFGLGFYAHYRNSDSGPLILCWLAVAMLLALARLKLARRYDRNGADKDDAEYWESRVCVITMLVGVHQALGLLAFVQPGEYAYNVAVTLWYGALISATASSAFAMKRTMVGFCGVVGGGLALRLASLPEVAYAFGAGGVLIYTGGMILFSLQTHRLQAGLLAQYLANRALTHQLEKQVQIASRATEKAERANREKSRFLAAASHDLRQPLHALALLGDSLYRDLAGTDKEQKMAQVTRSVSELTQSLNAMLDISRIDAGVIEPVDEAVPLADVFSSLRDRFLDRANASGLALRFAHRGLTVRGDRQMLGRVLSNLVENALKNTQQGGVLVAARKRHRPPYDVAIEVRDSGVGMAEDHHAHIFEEFYQIGNKGREREQGLGLGLAIVRRLVNLLSMEVQLRSSPGCGSKFEIFCRQASRADVQQTDEPQRQPVFPDERRREILHGKHILIVDNEAAIRAAMVESFRCFGPLIHEAASAEEAEELILSGAPLDLALVDYRLGGKVDGIHLSQTIREMTGQPSLPIVIVTGDTGSEEIQQMRAGGMEVLYKPLGAGALTLAASTALAPAE